MGYIIVKLFPNGRVERSEKANSWRERQELIAYALYLQPGLAALDVAAHVWRDLRPTKGEEVGHGN
jgi:hypothetical protein